MSEEANGTCPDCGTPRPKKLGYCRKCEYVFKERPVPQEKINSRYWYSTWLFFLVVYFIAQYHRLHLLISLMIGIFVVWIHHEFQVEWTVQQVISIVWWLIGLIPVPLIIFLLFMSISCSRKVIRVSSNRIETVVTTDSKGNTSSREVQKIETDLGVIEGDVGEFDTLESGKAYRCWFGKHLITNQPFVCEPFEPVYVGP